MKQAIDKRTAQPLTGWLYYASIALGLAPILFGLQFILSGSLMAEAFGVPLRPKTRLNDPAYTYLAATGVRDLAIGVLALAFALLKDRRAVGIVQLAGILVAVGDGSVVLYYAGLYSKGVITNFGIGAVIAVLAYFTFQEPQPALSQSNRKKA